MRDELGDRAFTGGVLRRNERAGALEDRDRIRLAAELNGLLEHLLRALGVAAAEEHFAKPAIHFAFARLETTGGEQRALRVVEALEFDEPTRGRNEPDYIGVAQCAAVLVVDSLLNHGPWRKQRTLARMAETEATFQHQASFEAGEIAGNLRHGKLEAMYEELFADVIEDGIITQEERAQLDKMADNLGLDRARLRKLEAALQAAYETRNRIVIKDLSYTDEPPPATIMPLEQATDQRTLALERRIKFLEERVRDLETELEEARANVAVEVDLSDVAPPPTSQRGPVPDDDPAELARRVRHDPRDVDTLHALFRAYKKQGDVDRTWCVTQVLSYLGAAEGDEKTLFDQHRVVGLIQPNAAVTQDAWRRLLFHPEEEALVGEIFAVVVSAVLLGRISAMRRDKQLVKLDPANKQDPNTTTVQAVRCFSWAAAILGMQAPALFTDVDLDDFVGMVPGVPPASRIGAKSLSGRSASELAFLAGRHLANYREEHFVKMLVPSARGLEDIFLAALSIGNPGLPLSAPVKQLVVPIAKAIEPILEPQQIDRLRGHFLRFVEEGGRANLQRWQIASDRTLARAGLLLANDLRAAHNVFAIEDMPHLDENMDDLMSFVVSDRYSKLRKQIGIAIPS